MKLGPRTKQVIVSRDFRRILNLLTKKHDPEGAYSSTMKLSDDSDEYGLILYEIGNIFKNNYRDMEKWRACFAKIPDSSEYFTKANDELKRNEPEDEIETLCHQFDYLGRENVEAIQRAMQTLVAKKEKQWQEKYSTTIKEFDTALARLEQELSQKNSVIETLQRKIAEKENYSLMLRRFNADREAMERSPLARYQASKPGEKRCPL